MAGEMVERVAEAIFLKRYLDGGVPANFAQDCPEKMKPEYREQARAAIEAYEKWKAENDAKSTG